MYTDIRGIQCLKLNENQMEIDIGQKVIILFLQIFLYNRFLRIFIIIITHKKSFLNGKIWVKKHRKFIEY